MIENATRSAIIGAGRELFGERGYTAVTIKDVAARAGFSPAMVMKVMGSKADLYAVSAPPAPVMDDGGGADEPVGYQLVRRLIARRDNGEAEPWAMAPLLIQQAPDPESTRTELRLKYVGSIARRIGDASLDQRRANLVVCLLLGLGAGIRTFGLLGTDEADGEGLIREYGALVQAVVDAD
ncbi:TetR family transcriptional regulator [Paenarthrobacter sp. Z7-10]|uniref:TetR/AcrR family transcriptional regulator n=1 Tax=Paenarthrobacter sp. Z7-10 TaxID=2787635 RepID=UPI0022A92F82|nr:TetR/AcrR family transcriptional regulator [Paenarthrobacter sp. Z7-10]MCZ2401608.1 TetR family transcriptional regulator [Paenarthrobacter sp. Z7-10]